MKVVDHALEVLPPCPGRLSTAVKTAIDAIVGEGQGFAQDVTGCAASLVTDLQAVAAKMQEIPGLLNPQPIIDCCKGVLEKAATDLRQLADDAAAIPQRLLEQAKGAERLIDSARAAVEQMSTLLPELAQLKPDIGAQMAFFQSLPARGQALADLAVQSAAMVDQYGRELLPLSTELKRLAMLERGAASAATEAILQKAEQLQSASLSQVQTLRDLLDGNVADLEQAMQEAIDLANQTIDGVADLLADKSEALLQPLQDQIDFIAECRTTLADETTNAEALFDEGCAQLLRLSDILMQPLATARQQLDSVIDTIADAGAMVDDMAQKALTPIDALDVRVDNVARALGEVITAIENEVAQVVQLMRELDEEAEQVKPILRALPDHFEPVRTSIAAAIALLVQVKDNIPPFVNEAKSALRTADSELNQADDLCTHAIEICTLYQMKAPPLMVARVLFVGIKTMIPPLHATIASALSAVQTVGNKATALMDTAIGVVDALNPLLDQAVALVQQAIDALLLLLQKLQDGLKLVMAAAESVPPVMRAAVDKALATAHEVLAKVRQAAEDCLAQLQCEALVQRLQQQLSDLLDRTFAPLEAQIDAASGPLRNVLQQGKVKMREVSGVAQDGLMSLSGMIGNAQEQGRIPVQALKDALRSAQQQISATGAQARQAGRGAADHALSYLDQAAQAISDLKIREMAGPAMAYISYVDQFADTFQSAREQVTAAGSLDDVVGNWRSQAQQQVDGALEQVKNTAQQALQSTLGIQLAGDEVAAGAQAQRDTLVEDGAVSTEVKASFDQMQADAQGVADQSGAALDQMSGALDDAKAQSETVGEVDPDLAAAELADVQSQADQAAAAAEEVKAAEQNVAAEIVKAQEQVAAAAKDAEAQSISLKDEAQAEIQKAQAEVESVQAAVNAARADAIKAEAIVDAEVVKHGGTSSKADEAADSAGAKAAASTAAGAAAAATETTAAGGAEGAGQGGAAAAGDANAGADTDAGASADAGSGSAASGTDGADRATEGAEAAAGESAAADNGAGESDQNGSTSAANAINTASGEDAGTAAADGATGANADSAAEVAAVAAVAADADDVAAGEKPGSGIGLPDADGSNEEPLEAAAAGSDTEGAARRKSGARIAPTLPESVGDALPADGEAGSELAGATDAAAAAANAGAAATAATAVTAAPDDLTVATGGAPLEDVAASTKAGTKLPADLLESAQGASKDLPDLKSAAEEAGLALPKTDDLDLMAAMGDPAAKLKEMPDALAEANAGQDGVAPPRAAAEQNSASAQPASPAENSASSQPASAAENGASPQSASKQGSVSSQTASSSEANGITTQSASKESAAPQQTSTAPQSSASPDTTGISGPAAPHGTAAPQDVTSQAANEATSQTTPQAANDVAAHLQGTDSGSPPAPDSDSALAKALSKLKDLVDSGKPPGM